jgi:hypothetical protein
VGPNVSRSRTAGLAAASLLFWALEQVAVAFGQSVYGPWIVLLLGLQGISSFVALLYGSAGIISREERSILVYLALGSLGLVIVGQIVLAFLQ